MITINTDKGLVQIKTWEDLIQRPNFGELDPATAEFDKAIGRYHLAYKVRCGLTSCHEPHFKGYLVTTKDGRETNIGHDCGRTYFGLDFEQAARQLDRDYRRQEQRDAIYAFQAQLAAARERVEYLRNGDYCAAWCYRTLEELRQGVPATVRSAFSDMAKTGDGRITAQREATEEEAAAAEAQWRRKLPRPYYVSKVVTALDAASFLQREHNLRTIVVDLTEGLKAIAANPEHLSDSKLGYNAKWVSEFEGKATRLLRTITEARRFLTRENILQFEHAQLTSKELAELRRAASKLPHRAQQVRAA